MAVSLRFVRQAGPQFKNDRSIIGEARPVRAERLEEVFRFYGYVA